MYPENKKAPERSSRAGLQVVEISGIELAVFCLSEGAHKVSAVTLVTARSFLLVEIRRLELAVFCLFNSLEKPLATTNGCISGGDKRDRTAVFCLSQPVSYNKGHAFAWP